MKKQIKKISLETINSINQFEKTDYEIKSFTIDCNKLKYDFHNNNILNSHYFKKSFEKLIKIENYPTIYWFEYDNNIVASDNLFYKFQNFKKLNPQKNTPAIYKNSKETNILYLGKSKECLWGRLILHLGFHKDKRSQGLLLSEWTNDINLTLKFNYCIFTPEMVDIIRYYEYKLAKEFNPLIGKHL